MGLELTREELDRLADHRLNHYATLFFYVNLFGVNVCI